MNTHVPHAHSVKSDICSLIPAACPRKKNKAQNNVLHAEKKAI